MTAAELKKLLAKHGCSLFALPPFGLLERKFETHRGGSGHVTVTRGNRKTVMPVHGSRKELGTGLVKKILKDLGIES